MAILTTVIAMLSIVSLQALTKVSLGILVLAGAVIAFLLLDYVLPKKDTVHARSLTVPDDVWTKDKTISLLVYAGSFLLGFVVFLASGEDPAEILWIGPGGAAAVSITILVPVGFHLIGYWASKQKK